MYIDVVTTSLSFNALPEDYKFVLHLDQQDLSYAGSVLKIFEGLLSSYGQRSGEYCMSLYDFFTFRKKLKILSLDRCLFLTDKAMAVLKNHLETVKLIEEIKAGQWNERIPNSLLNSQLWEDQKAAVAFHLAHGRSGNWFSVGLGKTIIALYWYGVLRKQGKAKRLLIFCINENKSTWEREIRKHTSWSQETTIVGNGTRTVLADFERFVDSGDRILICHYDALAGSPRRGGAAKNTRYDPRESEIVQRLTALRPECVICDECFPYNTLVRTGLGDLPIGYIVENNLDVYVLSCNFAGSVLEWKRIVRRIKRRNYHALLRITHEGGSFVCTANHKIWTSNSGFIQASEINCTHKLCLVRPREESAPAREDYRTILQPKVFQSCTHGLPRNTEENRQKKGACYADLSVVSGYIYIEKCKSEVLQQQLCQSLGNTLARTKGSDGERITGDEPFAPRYSESRRVKIYEGAQSDAESCFSREDAEEVDWEKIFASGREWETDSSTNIIIRNAWSPDRICNPNCCSTRSVLENEHVAAGVLQSGFSSHGNTDSYRNRWKGPQATQANRIRQKENFCVELSRVVSTEVLELGCFERSGNGGQSDSVVYNLEVEDNHNYIADSILVSNCHSLQNLGTKRTKSVFSIFRECDPAHALFLTATPVSESPVNAYSILSLIRPQVLPSKTRFDKHFCNTYLMNVMRMNRKTGKKYKTGAKVPVLNKKKPYKQLDELAELVKIYGFRKTHAEVHGMPPTVDQVVNVALEGPQKALYGRIAAETYEEVARLPTKALNLDMVLVRTLRLRQILSHPALLGESGDSCKFVALDNLLAQHLADPTQKVIVWSAFKGTCNLIAERYKSYGSAPFHGDVPQEEFARTENLFMDDVYPRLLAATPDKAGIGKNLQRARMDIWVDKPVRLLLYEQARGRIERRDAIGTAVHVSIVASGTIDEWVEDLLLRKMQAKQKVLDDGQAYVEPVRINQQQLLQFIKGQMACV